MKTITNESQQQQFFLFLIYNSNVWDSNFLFNKISIYIFNLPKTTKLFIKANSISAIFCQEINNSVEIIKKKIYFFICVKIQQKL